jgi:hypothetical protein
MKYTCFRCGYISPTKTKMSNHINRKFPCEPLLNDICLDDYKSQILNNQEFIVIEKNEQKNENCSILLPPALCTKNKKEIICKYCDTIFTRNSNLNRHLKKCIKKTEYFTSTETMSEMVTDLHNKIKSKDKKIKNMGKRINELCNKTNIINNNNTIINNYNILPYDKTNYNINDDFFIKALKTHEKCIPDLCKYIHFNDEYPENHNLFLSDTNSPCVMKYDSNKWNYIDIDKFLRDINIKLNNKLSVWFEENEEKYKELTYLLKNYYNHSNKYYLNDSDFKVSKKIEEQIKSTLLKNSKDINSDNIKKQIEN